MKRKDYKCYKCNSITEHWVTSGDFPETILCPECWGESIKMISKPYHIIYQGKCGNYKNGYTSSSVSIKKT